jgi:hypothetical protein
MHRSGIALVLTLLSVASRSEDFGYVIIDAVKYPTKDRQPTWIAILRSRPSFQFVHVPVGKGIVRLEPGRHKIEHIDFGKSIGFGDATIHLATSRYAFDVAVDSIQFFGLAEIRDSGFNGDLSNKYRLAISSSLDVLRRACATDPLVMSKLPVRFATVDEQGKLIHVQCET